MHFTGRSVIGTLVFVGSVVALSNAPGRVGHGTDVSTILIDPRLGIADRPDALARKGSNLYVTVRYSGQVARIKTQTGRVDYIDLAPPATTGYAVHGIAVRP